MQLKKPKNIAAIAMLIAAALTLSYIERLIPIGVLLPLPGIKLGLANIATMFAIYSLGSLAAFIVLISRVLLASMFGGGVTGFLFSLTGGIFAFGTVCALKGRRHFSLYGVSIAGAAAHNIGQMTVCALIAGPASLAYLPALLLAAIITGTATGTLAIPVFNRLIR